MSHWVKQLGIFYQDTNSTIEQLILEQLNNGLRLTCHQLVHIQPFFESLDEMEQQQMLGDVAVTMRKHAHQNQWLQLNIHQRTFLYQFMSVHQQAKFQIK
jgi:hypothetical protein